MPKSGIAKQVCPCGSGMLPHLALSVQARSLHVIERVISQLETVYVCSLCVPQLRRAAKAELPAPCRRILEIASESVVLVWEEIADLVPEPERKK